MYIRTTKDGKLLMAIRKYFTYCLAFLGILLIIRLYESFFITNFYQFPSGSWKSELYGLLFDILVFLRISGLFLFPFIFLYLLKPVISKIFFGINFSLIALIYIILIHYFAKTSIPLGSDIFGYSREEIAHTIEAAGVVNVFIIIPFAIFIAFAVYAVKKIDKLLFKRTYSVLFALIIFISLFFSIKPNPDSKNYKTEFESYLLTNKLSFFVSKCHEYYEKIKEEEKMFEESDINQFASNNPKEDDFQFIDKEYPMLHKEETPDVLGSFFNKSDTLPNFVFIIVESLGRAYCGEKAYLGSFTPFFDSLMQKSLFWENFLSTSGRTFAVMPSMFASLPFAEKGFLEMGNEMPKFIGLFSLLKENGYATSFTYGGDAGFDNMNTFFIRQKVDYIYDISNFESKYIKLPPNANGFSWGYGDKEIFRKYIDATSIQKKSPRLDAILTVAMHSPFLVQKQDEYLEKVEKRIKSLSLTEEQKNYNRNYKQQLATVMYFDDALRYLITEYSKRKNYKNTIFIITGDHRMPEIPISTQIDRFHVPFVIYSPLLKKYQKFSSVSTHFDVTPSILAFLKQNYKIRIPSVSAWIGHGLDIQVQFRNIHSYPLMRNKNELIDYFDKEFYLADKTLYLIDADLNINPIENAAKQKELKDKFDNYKQVNYFVCKKNKLIPDSLLSIKTQKK